MSGHSDAQGNTLARAILTREAGDAYHVIRRDDNAVARLAAVTDANLQTATETAGNGLIGTPISYTDLNALANDNTFLRRIFWAPPTRRFWRPSSSRPNNWCFEVAGALGGCYGGRK